VLIHWPGSSYPISPHKPTNRVTELPVEPHPPLASAVAAAPAPPTLAQRIVAFTFLGAFGLTILTVVLTGLAVRNPTARRAPETTAVTLTIGEPRTVNLLFESRSAVEDVGFTVDLPAGIELMDRAGLRRVAWNTRLAAGNNLLPLTLVARGGRGGQLAARLEHGDSRKTFVVDLAVSAR
jgi:hypothetical protein